MLAIEKRRIIALHHRIFSGSFLTDKKKAMPAHRLSSSGVFTWIKVALFLVRHATFLHRGLNQFPRIGQTG